MSHCEHHDCCAPPPAGPKSSAGFRRALWIALVVNAGMFFVEFAFSFRSESVSLLADAVDFLGDAGNYALSLFVLGMAVVWRSRTALLKGLTMGAYGVFVLGRAVWVLVAGAQPDAMTMGVIGTLALVANVSVAIILYAFRDGDANMRSVWLCSRNDAIGNIAVLVAAAGVWGSNHAWPDLVVAVLMSTLGLLAARTVIRQSLSELKSVDRMPAIGHTPRG